MLGKSIDELPKVVEYNQTDKKSNMSRSLHTPGPKLRSKTPGRAASDIFGDQRKTSFVQSVASTRQDGNE